MSGRSFFGTVAAFSPALGLISCALMLLSFLWLGGWLSGSASILAIAAGVTPNDVPRVSFWLTIALAVLFGWPLLRSHMVARYVSTILKVFAVATFAAALVALWLLPDRSASLSTFAAEMLTPHWEVFTASRSADTTDLVLAITFLGLGSWASTLYTTYASLEGYGRPAEQQEELWSNPSATSGRPGALRLLTGPTREQLRGWYRHLYFDVSLGVLLNLLTTAILTFLAIAVLYERGHVVGTNYDLLSEQARLFEGVLGAAALPVFALIAAAFLLDTWVGFIPLMAKGIQETLQVSFSSLSKFSEGQVFRFVVGALFLQTVLTTALAAPGTLIRLTAVALNATHPFVIGLLIWLNYKKLPSEIGGSSMPSRPALSVLLLSFGSYSALALWYLLTLA